MSSVFGGPPSMPFIMICVMIIVGTCTSFGWAESGRLVVISATRFEPDAVAFAIN